MDVSCGAEGMFHVPVHGHVKGHGERCPYVGDIWQKAVCNAMSSGSGTVHVRGPR